MGLYLGKMVAFILEYDYFLKCFIIFCEVCWSVMEWASLMAVLSVKKRVLMKLWIILFRGFRLSLVFYLWRLHLFALLFPVSSIFSILVVFLIPLAVHYFYNFAPRH